MEEISLITYFACIISRLVYFNNNNFLEKYRQIMDISNLSNQLIKIKHVNAVNIFKPKINNILQISDKINKINYADNPFKIVESKNVKYIIISTSNYSSVYLIADKRTNTIFIAFRGTSSIKSGLSYTKITSSLPFRTCNQTKDGYLLGIFKIVSEIFYTISEGIHFLSNGFLKSKNSKLITTGHSLGGGCAQIFSYLWIKKHPSSTICCITFGSPRVMNGHLMEKYIKLINNHKIQFERIVTDGDPFPKIPPKTIGTSETRTYYHVDDMDTKLQKNALFCSNYKKTKKLHCDVKNKTKRAKINIKNHGNYLSINYDKAGQGLTDTKKEINRDSQYNTICRIIIGGDDDQPKVSFFNLQEIKTFNAGILKNITMKLSKTILTDYKHQDVYMNKAIFNKLIKESSIINKDDLNPLKTDNYVNVTEQIGKPKETLVCV
jgi:hypothetical protein